MTLNVICTRAHPSSLLDMPVCYRTSSTFTFLVTSYTRIYTDTQALTHTDTHMCTHVQATSEVTGKRGKLNFSWTWLATVVATWSCPGDGANAGYTLMTQYSLSLTVLTHPPSCLPTSYCFIVRESSKLFSVSRGTTCVDTWTRLGELLGGEGRGRGQVL